LREILPLSIVMVFVIFLISACGGDGDPAFSQVETGGNPAGSPADIYADGAFKIVATTTQAYDLASILTAGVDNVEITPLMGAGVDPHLYQPTESDIAAMNEADMVIYSGLVPGRPI
jgi:manganese/zinc/iron transport system substrate-binding protein